MNRVSIIVPVYNAEHFIEQTVAMVRKQTFSDWELILVEDCSKDNTKNVLENILTELQDERIRVIYKEKNEGAAKARNTGLANANGRYIAFLDADDIWLDRKLEKELAFMQEKNAGFVFTSYEFGNEMGRPTGKIVKVPSVLTYHKALQRTIIFTTTVLIDMEKIPKHLIEMPHVPSEDSATWWQIMRNGYNAYGLNEVLAIYRRPRKSLSSNKGIAIKRIWNLYRNVEKLSLIYSMYCFMGWAIRATLRRI